MKWDVNHDFYTSSEPTPEWKLCIKTYMKGVEGPFFYFIFCCLPTG